MRKLEQVFNFGFDLGIAYGLVVQLVLAFGACDYKLVFQFGLDKRFSLVLEFGFPAGLMYGYR